MLSTVCFLLAAVSKNKFKMKNKKGEQKIKLKKTKNLKKKNIKNNPHTNYYEEPF